MNPGNPGIVGAVDDSGAHGALHFHAAAPHKVSISHFDRIATCCGIASELR
jgi:hypothetical protein